jgi:TolA-binding protein
MNKWKTLVLSGMLLVCSYGYGESKFLQDVQESIVTKNTEFVQATMDQKCYKLQKKIRKLQDKLAALEFAEDEDAEWIVERKEKLLKDLKKCEELLEGLQRLNQTIEAVRSN